MNESDYIKEQATQIDAERLSQMREHFENRFQIELFDSAIEPLTLCDVDRTGLYEAGLKKLSEGKIAALILAGGQGTRLGLKGPKGCLEVTPICKKTLFHIICDKVRGASQLANRPLSVALMTSPQNHIETVAFFEENDFFGLERDQVSFYEQNMLPLFDEAGQLFLDEEGRLASGPDGNGRALHLLAGQGIAEKWSAQGVEYVCVIPIDNPLADPFDLEMIGYQERMGYDILVKSVYKKDASEKVGVIGKVDGHLKVVEYSELPLTEANRVDAEGGLLWNAANTGIFSVTLDYIRNLDENRDPLPWHLAKKAGAKRLIAGDQWVIMPITTWKFETFIFDAWVHSSRFGVMPAERSDCFSPIKGRSGSDSLEQAQVDLIQRDKMHIKKILNKDVEQEIVECDPGLYYLNQKTLAEIKERITEEDGYYKLK